jgi:hypothetical protein
MSFFDGDKCITGVVEANKSEKLFDILIHNEECNEFFMTKSNKLTPALQEEIKRTYDALNAFKSLLLTGMLDLHNIEESDLKKLDKIFQNKRLMGPVILALGAIQRIHDKNQYPDIQFTIGDILNFDKYCSHKGKYSTSESLQDENRMYAIRYLRLHHDKQKLKQMQKEKGYLGYRKIVQEAIDNALESL